MVGPYSIVPLSPLRKVIASRMTEAKRNIPHFRIVADIEMDALLESREQANFGNPGVKVTINDCLIKACAIALSENPAVNIQLVGDEIHRYRDVDISVVIAVEGGLATPVVRRASHKSIQEIAAEVKALAARAAAQQLKMDEICGGSFSVSNLGAYGIDQFDAIINPPQCAILAVGRIKSCLVVSEDRQPRVASVLRTTLSVDHRAIDGVIGAAFLASLRNAMENSARLFSAVAG